MKFDYSKLSDKQLKAMAKRTEAIRRKHKKRERVATKEEDKIFKKLSEGKTPSF